ncbi:MAG: replication-associated recombination protein A [Oscillospiraceae bacterium]|jgi:putative ATPase|nr:replication-associated recombination protein A [Oscillospiraceae bacterium]
MSSPARPLADRLRPKTLDDVIGQTHILAPGKLLRRLIELSDVPNLIFYGPSGTGKTTVANIIAERTQHSFRKLNATTASLQDVKDIIAERDSLTAPNGVLLYLDEIQYFNKKQQQSLLEYIEDGSIRLIASTTENPFFYVYGAVLSRCTTFEFKPVERDEVLKAIRRAVSALEAESGLSVNCGAGVPERVAQNCGGDVRKALNAVEILFNVGTVNNGVLTINAEDAIMVGQRSAARYDRDGDERFDVLSALQKSIRGSDPDAGLHYLARMLEAGDILSSCRRLLVIAAEDVGLAYPQAMSIVKACCDSARELGLPEARLPLSLAVLLLATAPKSNDTYAIDAAWDDIKAGKAGRIPRNLQNVHADGAEVEDKNQNYLYPHDYPNNWVKQQYLPDSLLGAKYYEFGSNKNEQSAKVYWEKIKGQNENNG